MSEKTQREYRRRISLAMDFISRRLAENPSLEEVARAASFSKFHFHRIFRAVVGETVAEFTRRLRLERAAAELLADPLRDVTSIALGCGFSSSQNFAKAFKNHFGESASAWRERCAGEKSNPGNTVSNPGEGSGSPDWQDAFPSIPERSPSMNAEVKELPAHHVAYVRHIGPYGPEGCGKAFTALMTWAGPRGLVGSQPALGIAWDDPGVTPPEKCRYDAAVIVPEGTATEGEVALQTLAGGPYAVAGFEVKDDQFQSAWESTFAWIARSGHQPGDGPAFERYLNDGTQDPRGLWQLEICVPVKTL